MYRRPKTTQEKRHNQENWHRGKRSPSILVDSYDDIRVYEDKSWKSKRKTQYRSNKRGKKHSLIISYWDFDTWSFEEYFKENNIPYMIEDICQIKMRWVWWCQEYRKFSYITGKKIVWWSDKDIGMKYLLKQFKYAK